MLHLFIENLPAGILIISAIVLPFLLSLLIGPKLIAVLRAMKAGQPIREACLNVNAPEHQSKVGTPTMGGIMIVGLILLCNLIFGKLDDHIVQCALYVLALTALLGGLDDYTKITQGNSDGVSPLFKIGLQAFAATAATLYYYFMVDSAGMLCIPFFGMVDIGLFFIPLGIAGIIGSSNAVNLTDGLDGLASGCMAIACIAFAFIAQSTGSAILLITMASACIGFLWFNAHPAKIFMGDTGSLCLGGVLGTIAICSGQALILVIIGAVFVAEACSVMIQVGYFKYTKRKTGEGKRFFLMAPLHHHFEKKGWKETQISVRLWIITFFCSLLGVLYYILSNKPI